MNKEEILEKFIKRGSRYTWDIYQPIPLDGFEITFNYSGRKCKDRLQFIKDQIIKKFGDKKIKILDVGCNLGYFVFELAKLGHSVTGIDCNEKFVNICKFLTENHFNFESKPNFIYSSIDRTNIDLLKGYDLVLCFSVIHHFKDKFLFLKDFASAVPYAFIEMDGKDFGELELKTVYKNVNYIGEANDQYGSSVKLRKTWECDSDSYVNIKHLNNILGRVVLKRGDEVLKRSSNFVFHTWIFTSLIHEIEIYRKYNSSFFPKLIEYEIGPKYTELKIEFIKNRGKPSKEQILSFYDFLKKENLFIVDFVRDMFLFDEQNNLKVVDLESIFHIDEFTSKRILKNKNKHIAYDTYEKQIEFLIKYFKL